jgi:oxygen-independent coproporphyrinogen-3 oxidase
VNRLSLGVQSFHDAELKTLGRIHSAEEALKSIELIKRAGMTNFSLDFMYGIPGQTMDSWRESLLKAVALSPTHISAYELTVEENTPLFELIKSQNKETSPMQMMPDEELILEMYDHAIDFLTSCGYEHYEISNFAMPGFRCIHNLNYWDRGEYVGAGAGAHSFVSGTRSGNIKDIHGYIDHVSKGIIPEIEETRLTPEEALREFIFLGLRKSEGISIGKAWERGLDILAGSQEMIEEDYLVVKDNMLRMTRKGIVISNALIAALFNKIGL